jgi:glycosyltransferase involved in cell wall biosynthesis
LITLSFIPPAAPLPATAPSPAGESTTQFTVDVILPALNEAEALPWVLAAIPAGIRAIVVDNGSTDDTAAVAEAHGATVVFEAVPGFGSACYRGLLAATADIVCFMDADGSIDPSDLTATIAPLLAGEADLVLRARKPTPGAMTWHQKVANRALAKLMRWRADVPLTDLGPMRAIRREHLLALDMRDRRSGWPLEMVLKAQQQGLRIVEFPAPYTKRKGGKSKVTGTVKGTFRAVNDMSRILATYSAKDSTGKAKGSHD